MKRPLIALLAASIAAPVLAQHQGHAMPTPAPKATAKKPAPKKAPAKAADPHAGHAMPAAPVADPHAGHDRGAAPASAPPADPHAGHDMSATGEAAPAPPVAPPPPAAFSGPKHAADAVYGVAASAAARAQLLNEHGNIVTYKLLVDQLEVKVRNGRDGYAWDGEAWYGGDIDKLWLKTEGGGSFGESPEQAEIQALYSRAIDPWFNLQGGVRYDLRPDPERAHLVLGIQGLAPYWFEVDGALFLSDKGDLTARFEAEYDQRITRKLILQPRLEIDLALRDEPGSGIGPGLSTAELGARLRYEIRPELAPYLGLEYERAFGDSADFRRAAGERAGGWSLLAGLRAWF